MLNPGPSIVLGVAGQTLELYPPEWPLGPPDAAATYAVYSVTADLDDAPELSGTATADSVDTTFDAASGPAQTSADRDKCNLTATTGITVGRRYLATNALGQRELVQVDAVESGASVRTVVPLGYDYASADTFQGVAQSFTLDTTWASAEENLGDWRVLWSYEIGGVPFRTWSYFSLVRVQAKPSIGGDELYKLFPDLVHEQYEELRGKHWEHLRERAQTRLDFDVKKLGFTLDQVRSLDWNEPLLNGMRLLLAQGGWKPPGRDVELFVQEAYKAYWDDLNDLKQRVLLDKGSSGGATQQGAQQLAFRR